ncbi:MAG: hypothetical protein HC874_26080 [Richelia sp. SL_2_1]|nr:hypothetical protein [Richelia sp. SL_2_1]
MIKYNVNINNIMVVFGGNKDSMIMNPSNGVIRINTTHNSFDYTAIIEFLELEFFFEYKNYSHIFTLHDTMEFGNSTDKLIKTANPDMWCTAVWGGQCNLMLLKTEYIIQSKDLILSWKNCTKGDAIKYEGELFRLCPENKRTAYPGTYEILGTQKPYNGVDRLVEYYTGIDLKKYKANYGQTDSSSYEVKP